MLACLRPGTTEATMAQFASSRVSLAAVMEAGLSAAQAAEIALQAGFALAESHAAGRIHGDLTADSILLDFSSGNVHARIEALGEETPAPARLEHIAPEVRSGSAPSVTADIYAFGRILERLRAAAGFDAATNATWEAAIHRALDPVPEKRFPTIRTMLRAMGLTEATASLEGAGRPARETETRQWGNFQLLQRLGSGSFGEVYRAWDPVLEREVALKLLKPHGLELDEQYAAIVAEARAIARVRHPNIISVYGVDRREGRVGFWSDYVRGQTLDDFVATHGPCTAIQAAEMAADLCDALTAVHQAGLLHRDIKANNAMRADGGRVLLMDFGLSQELRFAGGFAGTPPYMAPELHAGLAASVQTDIYAMGVLLLFLCTGGYPLRESGQSGREIELPPAVSVALQQVVRKATSPDPQHRYPSAANMGSALREAAMGESLRATIPGGIRGSDDRNRRKPWAPLLAVLLVVLGAGGLFWPRIAKQMRAMRAGTTRAAYEDYLAAEEALRRFDKPGSTENAIRLYQKTLDESPNFALAQAGLARADWRMYADTTDKKWADNANHNAAGAYANDPDNALVQMTVGMIHVAQGKDALGLDELERAGRLDPNSADIHAELAEAYRRQNRLTEAKAQLQIAIDLAPEDWRFPFWLGALQIDTGDYKSAEDALKLALEKTPDNARVHYNLGLIHNRQGRPDKARQDFERALQYDPHYVRSANALGNLMVSQGRYDEAIPMFKRAADAQPQDWKFRGSLADACRKAGKSDEAAANYRKAVELANLQLKTTPEEPFLVSRLGKFYASLHDAGHALPLMRKSLRLAPHDPQVIERVAESYEILGDRTQAVTLMTKALQLGFPPQEAGKEPDLKALRRDPHAPQQIREAATAGKN
ncbi:MAG: tetratricopeptide repeat protein [Acidobacteria bacterium]|nr:tetratricopeptide repeat protein [Acidobacteriota bacterium]